MQPSKNLPPFGKNLQPLFPGSVFHYSAIKLDAADSYETLVTFYCTIKYHIPEERGSHFHCFEKLKSHNTKIVLSNAVISFLLKWT
jgi:hypothetical protein